MQTITAPQLIAAASADNEWTVHEVTAVRAPARCADGNGTLTPLFFSDDVIDIARAKAICSRCQRRATCLQDALDRAEPWGVWGGELLDQGRVIVAKRPRGRPPKHARPVLVVGEGARAQPHGGKSG